MDPFCPVEMEFLSVGLRFCVVSKLSSPVDVLMMHLLAWPVVHILTLPLIIWGRSAAHDGVTMSVVDGFVDRLCQDIGRLILGADRLDDNLTPLHVVPEVVVFGCNVLGTWTPLVNCSHLHCPAVVFKNLTPNCGGGASNVESGTFEFLQ